MEAKNVGPYLLLHVCTCSYGTARHTVAAVHKLTCVWWRVQIQHLAEQYGLTCPITKKLMQDPVMAADGYTYERSAIMQHLNRSMLSPVTRARMPSKHLDDALAMRSRIVLLIPDA